MGRPNGRMAAITSELTNSDDPMKKLSVRHPQLYVGGQGSWGFLKWCESMRSISEWSHPIPLLGLMIDVSDVIV